MLTVSAAEARVAVLIEAALKAGADAADAVYRGDSTTALQVRLGALEDVERSEGEEIGLRFLIGRRSASVSSSDLSDAAVAALVERAAAMAREATEDAYVGLAPEERLARGALPDVEADDGGDPDPPQLLERARTAEAAARDVAGVTNSEGAGATAGRSVTALATSHGFCRGYSASGYSTFASVIAGAGAAMQRDHASHEVRWLSALDAPETIGRLAADRAVARLSPGKMPSGSMPVVFDRRVGGSLVGHLLGAIAGPAVTRKTSFLLDREGEAVFPDGITIIDDPLRPRGLRSKPFDGEGLPTARRALVEAGRLTGWLLDSASARQLGRAPTGHAARGGGGSPGASATNVTMAPGTISRDALIGGVDQGLYVTALIGQGVNPVTGDYSRGASGFLIEKGVLTHPVQEITIAGNLVDMFASLLAADDLEHRRSIDVPTLLVEGMTVAGA